MPFSLRTKKKPPRGFKKLGVGQFISEGPNRTWRAHLKKDNLMNVHVQETIKVWAEETIQLKPAGGWAGQEKGALG